MNFSFSEEDQRFQQEVEVWLNHAWPQEVRDRQHRSAMGLSKNDHVHWQLIGASELSIVSITHDFSQRVRCYALLAEVYGLNPSDCGS